MKPTHEKDAYFRIKINRKRNSPLRNSASRSNSLLSIFENSDKLAGFGVIAVEPTSSATKELVSYLVTSKDTKP